MRSLTHQRGAAISSEKGELILRAVGLRKHFGESAALNGLSLEVSAGEIVAILGPSGSGKSTLLLCLAGILLPDEGAVFYLGEALRNLSDARLTKLRRSEFGFLFQHGQLVPELTAIDNVSLPLRLGKVPRSEASRRARELLAHLGVGDMGDKRPGEMSGGQAQRVAVARAMIGHPRIVFADEPTGSLDSANAEQVIRLLVSAGREHEASIVIVTHEAAVAAKADRSLVVRDGVIDAGEWRG